jgi:DNA-binding beta-propeller fold protein YncE
LTHRFFFSGSSPQRLVVDPVHGWVYYTDASRGTVSKMMVDGSKHSDMFAGLDRPFGLALDYENQ